MIVGYFPSEPPKQQWKAIKEKSYKKLFSHDIAIAYLEHEVKESVEREMAHILSGSKSGFYASLRFLFAEVDYLAKLYWGGRKGWKCRGGYRRQRKSGKNPHYDSTRVIIQFMRKFKILTPTSGIHFDVFRHGLTHTHMPKWVQKGRDVLNWYVSNTDKRNMFGICNPELTSQVITAIDKFVEELREEQKHGVSGVRFNNFLLGYCDSAKILTRKELHPYARKDLSLVNP